MEIKKSLAKQGRASPLKSVLIVDDKYSFLKLTERLFRPETRIVLHTAQSSAEAADKMKLNPDLVLMDLDLGDGEPTGIDLVTGFRKQGFHGLIHMITGNTDPEKLSEALDAGANGYIVKGSSAEGNLKDQVTRMLFSEENSPGGGR